ncbi:hypothetical protein ACCO45_011754 [Purpureocillium lilacinum]|uniref:Uncharacterized protein n=1 Tax=Purpureocillium lilacinum TaxID=33203 RepID=A0ACC4DET2_PURLI
MVWSWLAVLAGVILSQQRPASRPSWQAEPRPQASNVRLTKVLRLHRITAAGRSATFRAHRSHYGCSFDASKGISSIILQNLNAFGGRSQSHRRKLAARARLLPQEPGIACGRSLPAVTRWYGRIASRDLGCSTSTTEARPREQRHPPRRPPSCDYTPSSLPTYPAARRRALDPARRVLHIFSIWGTGTTDTSKTRAAADDGMTYGSIDRQSTPKDTSGILPLKFTAVPVQDGPREPRLRNIHAYMRASIRCELLPNGVASRSFGRASAVGLHHAAPHHAEAFPCPGPNVRSALRRPRPLLILSPAAPWAPEPPGGIHRQQREPENKKKTMCTPRPVSEPVYEAVLVAPARLVNPGEKMRAKTTTERARLAVQGKTRPHPTPVAVHSAP